MSKQKIILACGCGAKLELEPDASAFGTYKALYEFIEARLKEFYEAHRKCEAKDATLTPLAEQNAPVPQLLIHDAAYWLGAVKALTLVPHDASVETKAASFDIIKANLDGFSRKQHDLHHALLVSLLRKE